MPELPEVETIRRGIAQHIVARQIDKIKIHDNRLRWPVPIDLITFCQGQTVEAVTRRAKYILIHMQTHSMLIHLGMSGSLRIAEVGSLRKKHDHVEILFNHHIRMLFNDPRRFGCFLVGNRDTMAQHNLLINLGPEPLTDTFDGAYLHARAKGRSAPVKTFIMDQATVVGVGNIYANEALFRSGIHPLRQAGKISLKRYDLLAKQIKQVLDQAITMGGTTLKDFMDSDGKPGYFQQRLSVYGRGGEPCQNCGKYLTEIKISQRTTVYCPFCQR